MLAVFRAQAAVVGTTVLDFSEWIFGKGWELGFDPGFETVRAAPDDGFEMPVVGTVFFEIDIPVTHNPRGGDARKALGTDAFGWGYDFGRGGSLKNISRLANP
jgi:hypothetical protein